MQHGITEQHPPENLDVNPTMESSQTDGWAAQELPLQSSQLPQNPQAQGGEAEQDHEPTNSLTCATSSSSSPEHCDGPSTTTRRRRRSHP